MPLTTKKTAFLLKIAKISAIILIVLVFLVVIFERFFLNNFLSEKARTAVNKSTGGLYKIDFKEFHFDIITGNTQLKNVKFSYDSLVYLNIADTNKAPNVLYRLAVKEVNLTGIGIIKLLTNQVLVIDEITIESPAISILDAPKQHLDTAKKKTPYQIISKLLTSVRVNSIKIDNASLYYENQKNNKSDVFSLKNLSLRASDFLIDSLAQVDTSRFFYSKTLKLVATNINLPAGELHNIALGEVSISNLQKTMSIKNINYVPILPDRAFVKRNDGHDRLAINCEEIILINTDFEALFFKKKLIVRDVSVKKINLDIFEDDFFPSVKSNMDNFPHQMFKKMQFKVIIGKVNVQNSGITYREFNPETNRVGKLLFEQINGVFTNVSNDSISINRNPLCIANLRTKFMGKSLLTTNWTFNLGSKKGVFSLSGKLNKLEPTCINNTLESLSKVRINKGIINGLTVNLEGNNYGTHGSTTILYDDFEIDFLKIDKANPEGLSSIKHRKILSIFANNLIFDANPNKKGLRNGQINFIRSSKVPYFGLLYKSLSQGIAKSVLKI